MNISVLESELQANFEKIPTLVKFLKLLKQDESKIEDVNKIIQIPLAILQTLTESFYSLNTSNFTTEKSDGIIVCIELLRILIKQNSCRIFFLEAQIDFYIYPFLMSSVDESVKISALELFASILKDGLPESMKGSELLPLLLRIVDSNSETLQILALRTLEMILIGGGLDYAVQTLDRFQAIDVVLSVLLKKSIFSNNLKLVKILMRIYCRLSDKPNVYQKLKDKSPEGLDSKEFYRMCEEDKDVRDLKIKFMRTY